MDERPQQIIIKKIKKNKGGGSHGGSWKVAYADFVTAMMAFFLLLWLLSMVSEEKKAALSVYFEKYSVFQETGSSAITSKNAKLTDPNFINPKEGSSSNKDSKGRNSSEFSHKAKQDIDNKDEELVKKNKSFC